MDKKITTEEINKTLGSGENQKNFFLRYWWFLLILLIIGVGIYFYIQKNKNTQENNYKTTTLLTKDLIVTVYSSQIKLNN